MKKLLIAGGSRDPNICALVNAAQRKGIDTVSLLVDEGPGPSVTWNLDTDELWINGEPLPVNSVFVRRDVFHGAGANADYRALAWYTSLQGWLSCAEVRCLNRGYLGRYTNKLHALRLARAAGMAVPMTLVTNAPKEGDTHAVASESDSGADLIAKPVTGGGYCQHIDELLPKTQLQSGVAASPAIIQARLDGPDVRIYAIDDQFIGFRINSEALDYRTSQKRDIESMAFLPQPTVAGLRNLMTALGLDWCAADFKLSPETGRLTFLEINSEPMFSVFDELTNGAITQAMLKFLVGDCNGQVSLQGI